METPEQALRQEGLPFLPDSRPRVTKNPIRIVNALGAMNWVKTYCINCGCDGPLTLEETTTFFSYLCTPCAEKYGQWDGMFAVPEEVFFEKLRNAQIEAYGRELTECEMLAALQDGTSVISKLASERR